MINFGMSHMRPANKIQNKSQDKFLTKKSFEIRNFKWQFLKGYLGLFSKL